VPEFEFFSEDHRISWFAFQNAAKKVKLSDKELQAMWLAKIDMHQNPRKSAAVISDIQPYESPATGKMITSRSERREDFKVSGCREWEGMNCERNEAAKRKAETELKQDKALEHEVRTTYAAMPDEKKAALADIVSST
jgi:hypothetical protein